MAGLVWCVWRVLWVCVCVHVDALGRSGSWRIFACSRCASRRWLLWLAPPVVPPRDRRNRRG